MNTCLPLFENARATDQPAATTRLLLADYVFNQKVTAGIPSGRSEQQIVVRKGW